MPRVNVWMSEELAATVRDRLPEVNFSKVLADGLRDRLRCDHRELACSSCGALERRWDIEDQAVGRFYLDLFDALGPLVSRGGSAEGAARVAKTVAERHRVTVATRLSLPRPTRGERQAYKLREFPLERRRWG